MLSNSLRRNTLARFEEGCWIHDEIAGCDWVYLDPRNLSLYQIPCLGDVAIGDKLKTQVTIILLHKQVLS